MSGNTHQVKPNAAMLGKYQIRGILGRGAMGTVYDCLDPVLGRRVAIKTVRLTDAEDDDERHLALARFKNEAKAAGGLSHPNIVAIHDYGEDGETPFIVMEFVEGQSLKQRLDQKDPIPVPETVRIMEQMLAALQYSHDAGVVHRDIKPANVLLTKDGTVKLADFGIARIESSGITQTGTMLGTPAYMSPEQLMTDPVDGRSDIYSAGVVLFQLLTEVRPFDGTPTRITLDVMNKLPPRPSERSVAAPPWLDPVVACALAKRPEDRYQSALDFAHAIRAAFDAEWNKALPTIPGSAAALFGLPETDDDATRIVRPRARPEPAADPAPATIVAPRAPPAAAPSRAVPKAALGLGALLLAGAGATGVWYWGTSPRPAAVSVRPAPAPDPKPADEDHPVVAAPPVSPVATAQDRPAPPADLAPLADQSRIEPLERGVSAPALAPPAPNPPTALPAPASPVPNEQLAMRLPEPAPEPERPVLTPVTPPPDPPPAFQADSTEVIKALQQALKKQGCYFGPVSGQMTPATEQALKRAIEKFGTSMNFRPLTEDGLRDIQEYRNGLICPPVAKAPAVVMKPASPPPGVTPSAPAIAQAPVPAPAAPAPVETPAPKVIDRPAPPRPKVEIFGM